MTTLPDDMIVEIFLKLPIKTILRLKSVSRSWLSLISSTLFATLYTKQTCKRKIFISLDKGFRSFDTEDPVDDLHASELLQIPFTIGKRFVILGSCNGLLCVSSNSYKSMTIWNPFTNEYKKTPLLRYEEDWSVIRYGFGYDKKTDDYKIFVAIVNVEKFGSPLFNVYSLREDSWSRFLYNVKFSALVHDTRELWARAVYLDGTLHWVAKEGKSTDHKDGLLIISFDLAEEVFKHVVRIPESKYVCAASLGAIDGVLYSCVAAHNVELNSYICTMRQYRMGSSLRRLSLRTLFPGAHRFCWTQPLCFTTHHTVIFAKVKELVICNERTNSVMAMKCGNKCIATAYTESLISPNAFCKTQNICKRKRIHLADKGGKAKSMKSE